MYSKTKLVLAVLSIVLSNYPDHFFCFCFFKPPLPLGYPCIVLPEQELMPLEHHCFPNVSCATGYSFSEDYALLKKYVMKLF